MSGYDSLDVFATHGLVGIWGSLAVGIFSVKDMHIGYEGVMQGHWE